MREQGFQNAVAPAGYNPEEQISADIETTSGEAAAAPLPEEAAAPEDLKQALALFPSLLLQFCSHLPEVLLYDAAEGHV